MSDDNIVNLRPPTRPIPRVTVDELFSDAPRLPASERIERRRYALEVIEEMEAKIRALKHLWMMDFDDGGKSA